MATVKNYSLAGVSSNLQFGKAGGKIDFTGGAFSVKDAGGTDVEMTVATPTAADDSTKVATTAFVQTELSNFNDDRIQSADTNTNIIATNGSISVVASSNTQYTITDGKVDFSDGTQISAGNGTTALPAVAFDGTQGEKAGIWFDPTGSANSDDQVGLAVNEFTLETWSIKSGATAPVMLNNEMSDTEAKITATGTAANIDIRLTPKGTGQVFIGDGGSAASIGSGDSTADDVDAETMSITGGDGFVGSTTGSDGGSILLTPGTGDNAGADGIVDIQDDDGNSVMQFIGVDTAVNYFTATNSATGADVILAVAGETNADMQINSAGTGDVIIDGISMNTQMARLIAMEDLADVTDATNVAAAGAVMESDTTTAAMGFVIDDDTMGTASATTVATSESVKAYVDSVSGAVSSEDLVGSATGETILDGTSLGATGVNWLTLTNAATGSGPVIGSEGTDANIDISIAAKGSGTVIISDNASITGALNMNSQLINSVADPVSAQDAATKAYVDGVASGLDVKASVRVATTAAGTLATDFENTDTIDGVTLATNDRILIKNQASGSENGIYVVQASGAPVRSDDADNTPSGEVTTGMFTFVEEGTLNADSGWVLTTANPITLDTTALTFSQFSGAGAYTNTGGAGITATQSGTDFTIAANTDDATIRVNGSDNLAVSGGATDVSNKMLVGAGSNTDAAWAYLGDLRDSAGLLTLASNATASAVNNLEITNAATAGNVKIAAVGSDTDIDLELFAKGAGDILAQAGYTPSVDLALATKKFVDDSIGAISTSSIVNGTSDVTIGSSGGDIVSTVGGTIVSTASSTLLDVNVQISGADGSAAAPAYAFESDVTSGMYHTATGAAAFADDGVEALELGLTGGHASITALGTNINIKLVPTGTGFIDASSSLISNVTDPVGDQDAATKKYVDDLATASNAGDVRTLKGTFVLTGAATLPFSAAIPAGATVTRVMANVTATSSTATTVNVGISGNTSKYMADTENDTETTGLYVSDLMELEGSAVTPDVVVATPGATGSVDVIIEYRTA